MNWKLYLILLMGLLHSCSQEIPTDVVGNDAIPPIDETNLIDKETMNLNSSDVKKVSVKFREMNGSLSRTERDDVDVTVTEVKNPFNGEVLLYIVNRGHNEGYMVISATKAESPVLIFSETGSFDPQNDFAAEEYLNGYVNQIANIPPEKIDSLRHIHALEWAVFEKSDKRKQSRAIKPEITDIESEIASQISKKQAQGYTYVGKIATARDYLTEQDYQNLILDVSQHSDPNYDYEYVSLFFVKQETPTPVGPLIGTSWHQGAPFNVDAPNGYAGCVPVAMAQILYHYKYPSKYNWNEIYKFPISNTSFNYFIKDIRDLCEVEYKEKSTSSTSDKAKKAFSTLGYEMKDAGQPDFIKLRNEVTSGHPVFMEGRNDNKDGHAWVCEGYQNVKYEGVVAMIINTKWGIPDDPTSPYYDYKVNVYPPSSFSGVGYGEFYYMNMGWGGKNNGWYRSNTYISDPDYNFHTNQKMHTVRKK